MSQTLTSPIVWPPVYTLKKSARARHVKLKASITNGLELVVPLRFNHRFIPEILERNKSWIEKQLAKINFELQNHSESVLPDSVTFPAFDITWKISYIKSDNKKLQLLQRPTQLELVLLGNTSNKDVCKDLLITWVRKQAKIYLPQYLKKISEEMNISFSEVSIRNQRSRWGSCSSKKAINLNFKLVFLPEYLIKHILIHELCHTRQMDHSPKFWRLVASFDPDWKIHSRETRRAEKLIPTWAI